ncbi:hypothetical protein VTH82DRAFT_1416 [Thermothelomyces myriococcoides]
MSQQLRFSEVDQEDVNALLQDYLESTIEEAGNEKPFVAPTTQVERDRIWTAWIGFCGLTRRKEGNIDSQGSHLLIDPYGFWIDFARDPSAPRLQAQVKAFLHKYVTGSVKERVVLGPEERVMRATVARGLPIPLFGGSSRNFLQSLTSR